MTLKYQAYLLLSLVLLFIFPFFALTLYDLEGKKMNVITFISNGKWTIVEIWSSRCGICRRHMLKISTAQAFVKKYKMPFKNVITNSLAINGWLQNIAGVSLKGTPTFIIFDPKGQTSVFTFK